MTLKVWSFSKKKNSTARPLDASATTFTVYLKENTSLEKPVFILGTSNTMNINYCQFNSNYYFVDDIVIISKDQIELHCTIDVLATHKTAIGNYSAFVERSASEYNTMLYDSRISQSQAIYKESRSQDFIFEQGVSSQTGTYVAGVIGAYGSGTGGISIYALTPAEFAEALDFMFTESNFDDVITDSMVKSFFNPFQYIVFVRWYPVTKAPFGVMSQTKIKFGWWTTANEYDKIKEISISTGKYLTIPSPLYTDFRGKDSRFTQYFVEIPSVGMTQIDPSIINSGDQILLGFYCDIATGTTIVNLEAVSGGNTVARIGQYTGQWGASIPVGQVNGEAGSIIGGATSLIGGLLTMNPLAMASGTAGILGSYNPPPTMMGTYGSRAFWAGMVAAGITVRSYASAGIPDTHFGRPLEQNRTLNTLSGFIKCFNASIALAAPDSETDLVNKYLNTGFYYE